MSSNFIKPVGFLFSVTLAKDNNHDTMLQAILTFYLVSLRNTLEAPAQPTTKIAKPSPHHTTSPKSSPQQASPSPSSLPSAP